MTDNEIIKFYIFNNPYFTSVEEVNGNFFCTNKYGKDFDCNCAFMLGEKNKFEKIEQKFADIGKVSVVYNVKTPKLDCADKLQNYSVSHGDVWLSADVKKFVKKFSHLRCPSSITIQRVTTETFDQLKEVSKAGFSSQTEDNPYSNVELFEYDQALFDKLEASKRDEFVLFLLNYKDKNVGSLNINIKGDICYIAGFTILPECRRTHAFFALKRVLEFLEQNKIKTILCLTEEGGYPSRLYKKLGFETLFTADIYVKR